MKFDIHDKYVLTGDEKLDQLKYYFDHQRLEVDRQEYLCECALKNLLNEVSHYSYMYSFIDFNAVQEEFSNKKKDKPNVEVIKNRIAADFFNGNDNFEITRICACGFELYGWSIDICKDNHNLSFFFPMRDRISEENYEYMLYGKIGFYNCKNEYSRSLVYSNYNVEKVAEAVKNYFDNI